MDTGRLERAYRAFVRCHEVVATAPTEAQLFADICAAAVNELGFRLAWVGLVSAADDCVRPAAQAGYEAGYLESIVVTWGANERGLGPTGRAIRDRAPAVCQEIKTDERFAPWRADAIARGYGSSAALPLCIGSERIGALNLYATESNAFDDEEIALLEEVAVELVLGVIRLRHDRRLETVDALVERAARAETATTVAAAVAHDVNNLLHVVSLSISSAQEATDATERSTNLSEAASATMAAASLMRQFMCLTRRTLDSLESVEVDRVLAPLRQLLARLAPHAPLDVHLDARGGRTRVDCQALERIVINLVVNAGHAVRAGGTIAVSTGHRRVAPEGLTISSGPLPGGSYVELTVADTGEGIAPDVLPRIFEPFFTTKGRGGTGLGLSSVLQLARAAGGGVSVASHVGAGTRVSVLVPLVGAATET